MGGVEHTAVLRWPRGGGRSSGRPRGIRPRWAPALAAAGVVAVVGASAGIGVALTAHHGTPAPAGGYVSTANSTPPSTLAPTSPVPTTSHPPEPRTTVPGGPWNAVVINHQTLSSDTLTGQGTFLYAIADGFLIKVDPGSGDVMQQVSVPYDGPGPNRPVAAGNKIWVIWSSDASGVALHAFNPLTLSPEGNVTLSGGQVPGTASGIVTTGPDGDMYVAVGGGVQVVDPTSGSVVKRIPVSGAIVSVAVSPDGSKVYAGSLGNGTFQVATYNAGSGARESVSSTSGSAGGYLVASSGGVWYTTGTEMTQRVWFAPVGDVSRARLITGGDNGGPDSAPTYVNGVVWVGGTQQLECLDPATGKVLAKASIPSDGGVPEHFGSLAYAGGHAYATYQDLHSQLVGVAAVTPPSACVG